MPFKSNAQKRLFGYLVGEGKISPETYEHWKAMTGTRRLPEKKLSKKEFETRLGAFLAKSESTKGDCFRYANSLAPKLPGSKIVHAEVKHPETNQWLDHAWVEHDSKVHDWQNKDSNPEGIDSNKYRSSFEIRNEAHYEPHKAMVNMVRSKHHGPWHKAEEDLAKMSQPTPKFPKLGLKDDRRETQILTTDHANKFQNRYAVGAADAFADRHPKAALSMPDRRAALEQGQSKGMNGVTFPAVKGISQGSSYALKDSKQNNGNMKSALGTRTS